MISQIPPNTIHHITPILKAFSALSPVSSTAAGADESTRSTLGANREFWFVLLVASTMLVFIGVVLEEAEGWMPYLNRVFPIDPITAYRWIKKLAKLGWILIVLGVMGEGVFEIVVSRADTKLQQFDEALLIDARRQVEALSPRNLDLAQQREIAESLKPFAGHQLEVDSYAMDGEGTALATELIVIAYMGTRKAVMDGRANRLVSGGFEWGIAIRGPASEMALMSALQKSLATTGKMENVVINGPAPPSSGVITGRTTITGSSAMVGGGGTPVQGPIPTEGPVIVMVGIRPPVVLPNAGR